MTQSVVQFNNDQLALVKNTVAKGTTNEQFKLFIEVCKYHGLNPFARQIYAVVRNSKQSDGSYEKQMTIQTSIDGYRLLAERSGKYAGQLGPEWCGDDNVWKDVWLSDKPPAAARIGVLRKDFAQPTWGVAKYKSYAQSTPLWTKMPDVLLAKCAESLALRKAFPAEMSGIYTAEEMQQADGDLPTVALNGTTTVEAASTNHVNGNGQTGTQEGQQYALRPSDLTDIRGKWAACYAIPESQIEERWPNYLQYILQIAEPDLQRYHLALIERDLTEQHAKQIKALKKRVESLSMIWDDVKRDSLDNTFVHDRDVTYEQRVKIAATVTEYERGTKPLQAKAS